MDADVDLPFSDISYADTLEGIEPAMLEGFFEGWPSPPSLNDHLKILNASTHCILALTKDSALGELSESGVSPASGSALPNNLRVIGFITAISDGFFSAYIPLLEVLPQYRGRGIGSELVKRMLGRLEGCRMVDLSCDDELCNYYSRFGMEKVAAMVIRRRVAVNN